MLFLFLLSLSPSFLDGKEIPSREAAKAGISFYYERASQYQNINLGEINIADTFRFTEKGILVYFIFNLSPDGFVVVAADDRVKPVLAYSFTGRYSEEGQAPQFKPWMGQYARQIVSAIENDNKPSLPVTEEWDRLLTMDAGQLKPLHSGRDVQPMTYSTWNQNWPYNSQCPEDPAGPGGHTYAGCVPTAMAQLMYYYRWPETGTGSYTYEDPPYGTLSVNYDSASYDWNSMKNYITVENPAIAQLMFHLGVSCDLQYGPGGSGMFNHKSAYAWRTFFKYAPETQYLFRDSTALSWDSILIAHLDRKMPLYYAGWSVPNIVGHGFVCDGYQGSDYFHFNFGWGGSSDGYYYTGNLIVGGNNFNLAQEIIINCHPDTVNYQYPAFPASQQLLKTMGGSLEDGSGPRYNYLPNTTSSWLIDPQTEEDSVASITLTFHRFNTSPGDVVTIYDGGTTAASILGSFSGDSVPAPITGISNKMLIIFTTGSGPASEGWFATYSVTNPVWCIGVSTIHADTAFITDGSFRFNYSNNSSCRWKIYNTTGEPLTIYFRSFDTEPTNDILNIFDLATMSKLGTVSGHYDSTSLPAPFTSPSGSFFLMFVTNSSVTAKGWEIYYPKSTAGIREQGNGREFKIFPNPAGDLVTLSCNSHGNERAGYSVYTTGGMYVMNGTWDLAPGHNSRNIDLSSLRSGFYIIEVRTDQNYYRNKLIINKK